MKLILFTQPNYFIEENQIVNVLFDEGLDILHLYKPDTTPIYAERFLTLIPEKYHKRIIVHDHFYLKDEYRLKGIHLSDRNPFIPEKYSGTVTATSRTLEGVVADKKNCDYVFLSNVFDSISVPELKSLHTAESLREATRKGIIDKHVMAMGGISADNILRIKDFGFGGAAIRGAIWQLFDPSADSNYRQLLDYFRKLRKLAD